MSGNVLVLQADLRSLHCDHWLLPADRGLSVSRSWSSHPQWDTIGPKLHGRMGQGQTTVAIEWEGPCRPWPTNVVTGRRRLSLVAEVAQGFLEAASAAGRTTRRAKPLLALPVLSTGYGGKRTVTGDVLRILLPVLEAFVRTHDVDIALVAWTPEDLAAAQAARTPEWSISAAATAQAIDLARKASQQRLVVFMGAGVSAAAGLPMWGELLDQLAVTAGFAPEEREQLARIASIDRAQLIARRMGSDTFKSVVSEQLQVHDRVAVAHALLAGLPVREFITTNYDDCFERAAASTGRPVAVLPYAPASGSRRWLLKMHGCVTTPDDIVLTREDYVRYGERSAALAGIVQAMLITRHMLFVGFSLDDDNFHRIVDAVRRALVHSDRDQLGTTVTLVSNPLIEQLWGDDLDWVHLASAAPLPEAARRFELFLDCLAYHAASPSHLLNPRFTGLLSPAETQLRDDLEPIRRWLSTHRDRDDLAAVRQVIAQMLSDLGD